MNDYVILAAGKGARLWPITADIPKTMIRIMKKPVLEWLVEGILEDARKIVLVVGYKKEAVTEHFSAKPYADKIVFVEQKEQKGTGHAVLQARDAVGDYFVTLNGDNFFDPKIFSLIREQTKNKKFFAVGKRVEDVSDYGEMISKNGFLTGIAEKTGDKKPGLANTNTFFLPREFFDYLEKTPLSPRGEIELTDAVKEFAAKNSVRALEFVGYWSDIAFFWNYLDVNYYALENLMQSEIKGEVEDGVVIKGKVFIGEGTLVRNGVRIEGPVFIGSNNVIGPHAFLRGGAAIEDGCHIGSSEVKNSIIMRKSNAPHYTYVGDSVVCEDVNLGAGATTANLRFNNAPILATDAKSGKKIDSGRRKLGCVIGAGTRIGINASINCGIAIGRKCRIYPHTFVKADLPDETRYIGDFDKK